MEYVAFFSSGDFASERILEVRRRKERPGRDVVRVGNEGRRQKESGNLELLIANSIFSSFQKETAERGNPEETATSVATHLLRVVIQKFVVLPPGDFRRRTGSDRLTRQLVFLVCRERIIRREDAHRDRFH